MYTKEKLKSSCLWGFFFALLMSLVLTFASQAQLTNTRIAFVSRRDGNDKIYVMNVDGTNLIRLTNDSAIASVPDWSPDGTKIAFASNRDGNWEIYVMDADGGNQTRITNHPANDDQPSWSPDGRRIAFRSDRDGNPEIYVQMVAPLKLDFA